MRNKSSAHLRHPASRAAGSILTAPIVMLIVGLVSLCTGLILQLTAGNSPSAQTLTFVGAGVLIGSIILLAIKIRYRTR
jgi:hypothetical protein